MEKLAILGGMGPLATKVFYEKIIAHEMQNQTMNTWTF